MLTFTSPLHAENLSLVGNSELCVTGIPTVVVVDVGDLSYHHDVVWWFARIPIQPMIL